jgi:hypothetical protein
MRFPKETVAAIHDAAPHSTVIRWPAGAAEPQKGRVYWLQVEEEMKAAEEKAERRAEYSPETHADVLAWMHFRRYGRWPEGYEPKPVKVPRKRPDDVLLVLDVEPAGRRGWDVRVAIFEDPDPVRHTGLKTRVAGGPNPINGAPEPTELEPEKIVVPESRSEREDREDAHKVEHEISVHAKTIGRAEQKLANERRRGKRSKLAQQALERARKRAALVDAGASV